MKFGRGMTLVNSTANLLVPGGAVGDMGDRVGRGFMGSAS